jgi:hypothetical protein
MNSRAEHISWEHGLLVIGQQLVHTAMEEGLRYPKLACKSKAKAKFNSCSGFHCHDFPKQLVLWFHL